MPIRKEEVTDHAGVQAGDLLTDQDRSSLAIHLEGEVNVAHATELKALLMEALAAKEAICIGLAGMMSLDVCIVQLLVTAIRLWNQVGLSCTLTGPMDEQISKEWVEAGFELPRIDPLPFSANLHSGVLSEV